MNHNTPRMKTFPNREMPAAVFSRFSKFIYEKCGVKMPPAKRTMLTARLSKRLRHLGITSFDDYYHYVTSPSGLSEELVHLIDVVTTNKTDFLREKGHFDFLINKAIPELFEKRRISDLDRLTVWSAGCSSGEEPYTLCMFLSDFFEKHYGDYHILATDISTRILNAARNAIYSNTAIQPIPHRFRQKYLLRGKGSQAGFFRIIPELRKKVGFGRINLLEGDDFGINGQMDIIFCRNVIIYFDRPTQIRLFRKFKAQLRPGGYLFIGHSESLHGISTDFVPVGSAVYRKPC